ncbi:AAA family ATPase [Parvibaculum sp.]|jgi:pilus assembly protein CpaE|uniref:AAA family ATPase n=1 Tax=Parvibaculum sp. TaxID=2024848 RepID=UPI000C5C5AEC|nr:AAA family ATPase [Parvibaculum sp.]MAM95127.1 CtpF protein [Parvibaculum sp.]|tara:strand:- start:54661 stop:55995 length:1335 start_codon:yes stop_codon:yes gene_type:complete
MSNLARKEPAVGAPPMPAPASEATPEAPPLVQPVTVAEETDSLAVLKPVPRITIHAFCEQPGTGSAIQRASEDRRLAKAHLTVHMGGIPGAIENYQQTATPNLIMVETRIGGPELFNQLGALAEVCDAGTKVVVIGHMNDVSLYREMIRQGVNEYLVAPLRPLGVIEAISRLYVDPDAPPIGRTIAFIGAKGGTGSSTIAHNIGWCISSSMNEDVVITDMDLPFGTAGLDFNQDPAQGIADALTAPERMDDVLLDRLLVKCSDKLSLFAAPAVLDRDFEMDADSCETVLDIVREGVPCVVVDLPHVWAPWTKKVLLAADEIVITATPDLASLRNAKNILDLTRQARPNDNAAHIVLNQVGMPKRPEIPVKDFAEAVGGDATLILPFNPGLFGTAANNGQMIEEIEPKGKAAEGFRFLAQQLCGREARAPKAAKSSLFSFLSRKG